MKHLNSQKGIVPAILIFILTIILVGGGAYYFKQQAKPASKFVAVDATANWKTYTNTLPESRFTIKYPPTWYVAELITAPPSEGGGTQEFLADSKTTMDEFNGNYPGDNAKISNKHILIALDRYVYRTEPLLIDLQGHTNDELLQKVVNRAFGTSKYGVVAKGTPWVNLGEESDTYSTVKFTKTTIDGHLAARLINNNAVFYIILVNS